MLTNVYAMPNAVGSKIFIFNKFVDNLDMMAFLDIFTLPCDCAGYLIFDKSHNHFITGNLKIISNNKLPKMSPGKYNYWNKVMYSITV